MVIQSGSAGDSFFRLTGEVDGSRVHSPAVKVTYSP